MGDFSKRREIENLRFLYKERPSYPTLFRPKAFKEKRHPLGTIFLKGQKEKHRPRRVKSIAKNLVFDILRKPFE